MIVRDLSKIDIDQSNGRLKLSEYMCVLPHLGYQFSIQPWVNCAYLTDPIIRFSRCSDKL